MRYPASEKVEIIQLVEQSHLPAGRTLDKLGIPRARFYRSYDRYREGGPEALADHRSRPDRVWNRIPDDVRGQIVDLALEVPELSPRELAVRFGLPPDRLEATVAGFKAASVWLAVTETEAPSDTPLTFNDVDQARAVHVGVAETPPTFTVTVLVFSEQVPLTM